MVGMSVSEVAMLLGKTDRTIRNYIREGRIKARRIENRFGWEYQVYDLGEFSSRENKSEKLERAPLEIPPGSKTETALQIITQENRRLWEEFKQLREANNRLAYDLGARDQRIKDLEQALEIAQNKLTSISSNHQSFPEDKPKFPISWWEKIFRRKK